MARSRLKVPLFLAVSAVAAGCGDDGAGDSGSQPTATEASSETGIEVVCGTYTDMASCEADPYCWWLETYASSFGDEGTAGASDTGSSTTSEEVPGYCDVHCAVFDSQSSCEMLDQCEWLSDHCEYTSI